MLRLIIQTKRRYKKIVKHKVKTSEEIDNNDSSCTGDESEDGQSSISYSDQDSDVSFESDNDEEIDHNSAQNIGPTDQSEDQGKEPKAATKLIKLGSTQQKAAEDGLYSRKITQRIQKEDMKTRRE